MTNVPGIVPKPYPKVTFPRTFAIILRNIAFRDICVLALPRHQTVVGWPSDGSFFEGGQTAIGRQTAVGRGLKSKNPNLALRHEEGWWLGGLA